MPIVSLSHGDRNQWEVQSKRAEIVCGFCKTNVNTKNDVST